MSYTNRNFTWDFDALKRFYEKYIVKWLNSAVSWTEAQKKQARANLGFGDGDIDAEPTAGSDNPVKSGAVYEALVKAGNNGYYVCGSSAGSTVRAITIPGYVLTAGGSIKVKMTNTILNASTVSFEINNTTNQKPLYYEGDVAGKDNTWSAGEIIEVFYDGTNFQSFSMKNVVVDDTLTENSTNAARSGDVYNRISKNDIAIDQLKEATFISVDDASEYYVVANRMVNSLAKLSAENGTAVAIYSSTHHLFPVLPGSTIKANTGYKFNYAVKADDSYTAEGYVELMQNQTGEITIQHAGYLMVSVTTVNNDESHELTSEEAKALVAAGIDVNLVLSSAKVDEIEARVDVLESGTAHHTDPKNLPWIYGSISRSGTYDSTRDAIILSRYIHVKAGSKVVCGSGVKVQARLIKDSDGSAVYQSYTTGTYTAPADGKLRFGFTYTTTHTFSELSILDKVTVDLITEEKFNRFDKRVLVNLYGIPTSIYRGCHTDETGLTEATIDYDAFIAPWDALVNASNGYLTKKDLGETYNGKHIYCYKFGISYDQPNRYKPVVFMVANVHGHEKSSTLGAFYLMKDLVEHYAESPVLQYLRDNVIIKVIPAANVYGIINNSRNNHNGVNINRNYPTYSWEGYDDSSSYNAKGSAPLSEPETQYIVKELLLDANFTALAMDIHTNGRPSDSNYGLGNLLYSEWPYMYFGDYDYKMRDVSAAYHANMRGIFDNYGVGGGPTSIYGALRDGGTDPAFSTWLIEATDIYGGTLEVLCGHNTAVGPQLTPYSPTTIKCCAEIIGNYIIQMLMGLAKD